MGILSRAQAALPPPECLGVSPVSTKGDPLCVIPSEMLGTGPESPSAHLPAGPSHSLKARASIHSCLVPWRLAQALVCSRPQCMVGGMNRKLLV